MVITGDTRSLDYSSYKDCDFHGVATVNFKC